MKPAYGEVLNAGLSASVDAGNLPFVPLFVSFVLIAVANYKIRFRDVTWLTLVLRAGLVATGCVAGLVGVFVTIGVGSTWLGQALWDMKGPLMQNRAKSLIFIGLYFLALRTLVLVPTGKLVRHALAGSAVGQRGIALYDYVIERPFLNVFKFAFAILMGATISIFATPIVGPVLAHVLAIASQEVVHGGLLLAIYGLGMVAASALASIVAVAILPVGWFPQLFVRLNGAFLTVFGFVVMWDYLNAITQYLLEAGFGVQ